MPAPIRAGTRDKSRARLQDRDGQHELANLQYNQKLPWLIGRDELLPAARHATHVTRWLSPASTGPATERGQMDSMAVCPDWSLAVWRGPSAPVIGFVACSARCNDGTRNVNVEGWTPGLPHLPPARRWDRLHTILAAVAVAVVQISLHSHYRLQNKKGDAIPALTA